MARGGLRMSVCVLVVYEHLDGRAQYDAYVEPNAPVLDIPDVALHAPFHLPQLTRLAPESRHLGPPGDARLHKVAHHVLVDERAVYLGMVEHVRARAHNAHVAAQHVEELRQLVDVGLAHEVAKGKLARVVLGALNAVGVFVDVHRAELVAIELLAVHARAGLPEEHRAGTLQLYAQGYERHERSQAQQHGQRHCNVERTLYEPVGWHHERVVAVGEHRHPAHVLGLEHVAEVARDGWYVVEMHHVVVADIFSLLTGQQLPNNAILNSKLLTKDMNASGTVLLGHTRPR